MKKLQKDFEIVDLQSKMYSLYFQCNEGLRAELFLNFREVPTAQQDKVNKVKIVSISICIYPMLIEFYFTVVSKNYQGMY